MKKTQINEKIPCVQVTTNIAKMTVLWKAIHRFKAIPVKVPMIYFTGIDKTILKFVWNHNRTQRAKASWRKKTLDASHTLISNYTTCYENKTVCHSIKTDTQINGPDCPEINPSIHSQLIYIKGSKNIQCGKTISSITGVGETKQPHEEEQNSIYILNNS